MSRELADAYGRELVLRQSIVADLLHASERSTQLLYLSTWLHHPLLTPALLAYYDTFRAVYEEGLSTAWHIE